MNVGILIIRYAVFAVIATVANLATQRIILISGDAVQNYLWAVALGTIVGLVVKYALDKRWIFYDISTGIRANGTKFILYSIAGVFTTAIFWGTETLFWYLWETHPMRELGAVIGLGIGYVTKYKLDRRFVFTDSNLKAAT